MAQKKENKKITINQLATTIDNLAVSVAQGFDKIEAKMATMATKEALKTQQSVLDIMIKEIRTIHEDNIYFRKSISSLNIDGSSYDKKIEDLKVRVERLEVQNK